MKSDTKNNQSNYKGIAEIYTISKEEDSNKATEYLKEIRQKLNDLRSQYRNN